MRKPQHCGFSSKCVRPCHIFHICPSWTCELGRNASRSIIQSQLVGRAGRIPTVIDDSIYFTWSNKSCSVKSPICSSIIFSARNLHGQFGFHGISLYSNVWWHQRGENARKSWKMLENTRKSKERTRDHRKSWEINRFVVLCHPLSPNLASPPRPPPEPPREYSWPRRAWQPWRKPFLDNISLCVCVFKLFVGEASGKPLFLGPEAVSIGIWQGYSRIAFWDSPPETMGLPQKSWGFLQNFSSPNSGRYTLR